MMLGIVLARDSAVPLARQIYAQIRDRILAGQLAAEDILPSTRELSKSLGVSRNTLIEAYELLWAEGYIAARQGSRYRVEKDVVLRHRNIRVPTLTIATESRPAARYDFRTGIPDLDRFPFSVWNRIQRSVLDHLKPRDLLYGDAAGYGPLREAIARWLLRTRGIATDPGAVFITSGATHALSLAVEALRRDGAVFAVENPCHHGIVRMLGLKGIGVAPVLVDEHGLVVEDMPGENAACAYVTPSHQFPLGSVLSASRRIALMEWAEQCDGYVIEDDYDSEYRYAGLPLTPLHSLNPGRVVYLGTFSKTLFPALRIGFALVPDRFRTQWSVFRRYTDVQSPVVEQAVLAEFLESGRMERHIRAMGKAYGRKREALVGALGKTFGDRVRVLGDKTGLHLAARFAGHGFGREFKKRCGDGGLFVTPCAAYEVASGRYADTLLLGYGNIREDRIHGGVAALCRFVNEQQSGG